jgi:hypothetical protein
MRCFFIDANADLRGAFHLTIEFNLHKRIA